MRNRSAPGERGEDQYKGEASTPTLPDAKKDGHTPEKP